MTYRNKKLLNLAKDAPCMHCGASDGTVVAAHSNQQRDGKGMGIKAQDYRIAFLCSICHHQVDQGFMWNKEEKKSVWEDAHRKSIGWLFENDHLVVR